MASRSSTFLGQFVIVRSSAAIYRRRKQTNCKKLRAHKATEKIPEASSRILPVENLENLMKIGVERKKER